MSRSIEKRALTLLYGTNEQVKAMENKKQYEEKDDNGVLFPNDYKSEEKHPDWTGKITIDGVTLKLAAWNKVSGNGRERINLSIDRWQKQDDASAKATKRKADDEEIPF